MWKSGGEVPHSLTQETLDNQFQRHSSAGKMEGARSTKNWEILLSLRIHLWKTSKNVENKKNLLRLGLKASSWVFPWAKNKIGGQKLQQWREMISGPGLFEGIVEGYVNQERVNNTWFICDVYFCAFRVSWRVTPKMDGTQKTSAVVLVSILEVHRGHLGFAF